MVAVWGNLRLKIRLLDSNSLWYRSLFAIVGSVLVDRTERASWLYRQMFLETADGYGLTLWGQRFGIGRYAGETDDAYRLRIMQERALLKGGGTDANRKKILSFLYGSENIRIARMFDFHSVIGGEIGEPMGSLNYARFGYKIYVYGIAEERLTTANHAKAISLLTQVNVFGNTWELYLESVNGNYLEIPIYKAIISKEKFLRV